MCMSIFLCYSHFGTTPLCLPPLHSPAKFLLFPNLNVIFALVVCTSFFLTYFPTSLGFLGLPNAQTCMAYSASGPCFSAMSELRPISTPVFVSPIIPMPYFSRKGVGAYTCRALHISLQLRGLLMYAYPFRCLPIHLKNGMSHTYIHTYIHTYLYSYVCPAVLISWHSKRTTSEVHACLSDSL